MSDIFQTKFSPVLFASLYGAKEDVRNNNFKFLDQDITGLRLGGQLSFNSQWQVFSSLSAEYRDNAANDPAFLKKRKDKLYDASLGLNFIPALSWLVKPQLSYSKNESNVDLNGFERSILSVNARKDFSW